MKPRGTRDCEHAGRLAGVSEPLETGKAVPSGSRTPASGEPGQPLAQLPQSQALGTTEGRQSADAGKRPPPHPHSSLGRRPLCQWSDRPPRHWGSEQIQAPLQRWDVVTVVTVDWTSSAVTGPSGVKC